MATIAKNSIQIAQAKNGCRWKSCFKRSEKNRRTQLKNGNMMIEQLNNPLSQGMVDRGRAPRLQIDSQTQGRNKSMQSCTWA